MSEEKKVMTPMQALGIVQQAAVQYKGTAQEHQVIAQAMQTIMNALPKQQPVIKKEEDSKATKK